MKKIVLIGAGSASFTQGLVADLIRDSQKREWHLGLVDIDPQALDTAAKLSKKMITAKKANIQLEASTDRCEVLPGADYVVTTVGVGGRRAWEQDVFIPRKYGIFQPVGDSVMPGGISRAMRMIPAMLDITRDVMKLCPNAYFFNYSNPMTYICRALRKETGFPVVGLCHGVNDMQGQLARMAGFDRRQVTSLAVGVNHLTFIYDFRCKGKDAWPVIAQKIAEKKMRSDKQSIGRQFYEIEADEQLAEPFAWELFEKYHAFPAPGDRHITEYYAERFPNGAYYGKTLGKDAYSFEGTIELGDKTYATMVELANSPQPLTDEYFRKFGGEHEQLLDIINSIEGDDRRTFSVNAPNQGAVENLPYDAVLELPAAATGRGLLPLQIRDYPDVLAGIINKHLAIAEVVVEAALTGSKELFAEAILMGGYIGDADRVIQMVDEMVDAHKQYLPQF